MEIWQSSLKILKDDVALSMSVHLGNPAVATGLEKIHISVPKKGSTKECSNHQTIALISYASKVMLKILQGGLQRYVNWKLSDVPAEFRKGRGIRDQIANICWLTEKARCKLELCMEQPIGSGLRKEYDKPVYYHPVYLTYTQSTSCKMLG